MKIGILANYLKFRYDIRAILSELNENNDIVVFTTDEQKGLVPTGIETRIINFKFTGRLNKIWKNLYQYFGKYPYPSKYFKFSQKTLFRKGRKKGIVQKFQFFSRLNSPKFLSFDQYLSKLTPPDFPIEDIDAFLVMSPHEEDLFLAAVSQTNKPITAYLHSWDHTAKKRKISGNRFKYLTWNEELKADLVNCFSIKPETITSVGSTQLALLNKLKKEELISPTDKKYFYVIASFGYKATAAQEVQILKHFSEELYKVDPIIKIIFRPYPLLSGWDAYEGLKSMPNIEFDDYQVSDRKELLNFEDITHKFKMMSNALAIVHAGTTVGLEGSYLNKPILYLNYKPKFMKVETGAISIDAYWKQFHLQRYYFSSEFKNVITDESEVSQTIQFCLNQPEESLRYTQYLNQFTPLVSMEGIAENFKIALSNRKK